MPDNTYYHIAKSLSQGCREESPFSYSDAMDLAKNALFEKYLGKIETALGQETLPDPGPWGNGASVSPPETVEISPPVALRDTSGVPSYRRVRRTSDGFRHIEDSYDQRSWFERVVLPPGAFWASAEGTYFPPSGQTPAIVLTTDSTTGLYAFGPPTSPAQPPAPAPSPKKPLPDPTTPARRRYRLKE